MKRRPIFRRRRRGRTVAIVAALAVLGGVGAQAALTGSDGVTPPTATVPTTAPRADGGALAAEPAPTVSPTPTASPTPEPPPPLTPDLKALGATLDGIVDGMADSLAGATVAIAVRDDQGRDVYDRNADTRLLPASTMKAVTAANVLTALGPTHRFETVVGTTGPVRDGRVLGDLVLVGGGDPVLSSDDYQRWVYPSRPATSLTDLADAVVAAGITEVTGGLIGDGTAWGPSTLASGWPAHYLSDQDARRISPLTVDAGLTVDVTLPDGGEPQVELHPADDPPARAAAMLASLLAERGVVIRGHVRSANVPVPIEQKVASVESPPVADLLTFTVQRSDNHLADTMARAAAAARVGSGSWSAVGRADVETLRTLGIDATGLRAEDGSGLSRLDRVTAAQLAELDVAMSNSDEGRAWVDSLAVAGVTGTLKHRLLGTPGQGRFRGKTGTLDDVKAVVGHVTDAADADVPGDRLHLAVIANGVPAGGQWAVTVLMDSLQLALVDHLDGCHQEAGSDGPVRVCPDAA